MLLFNFELRKMKNIYLVFFPLLYKYILDFLLFVNFSFDHCIGGTSLSYC